MTAVLLMLLGSLTPAAGTSTAGTIWLARLWLRYRAETAGQHSAPEVAPDQRSASR